MRPLILLVIAFLTFPIPGRSQENTPIGERIWKREVASESKMALMIAVTLRKGDDISKQIEPFKAVTNTWWRQGDSGKERLFLMSVIDEETRQEEVRRIVAKTISDDEALRKIVSQLAVASLVFGTPEGKTIAEFSLKVGASSKR